MNEPESEEVCYPNTAIAVDPTNPVHPAVVGIQGQSYLMISTYYSRRGKFKRSNGKQACHLKALTRQ